MKHTVTIGSITYAQKARRALSANGVRVRLAKTAGGNEKGCAYGLLVEEEDLFTVARILRSLDIPYSTHDLP